jgi:broad specificity phosphatase PhoE
MGTRWLYLVRHGQNDRAKAPDELGPGLTGLGQRQAQLTAGRLNRLPISAIHHSPLRRAVETAQILAAGLAGAPLQPSPLLRECIPYLPPTFKDWFSRLTPEEAAGPSLEGEDPNSLWLRLCPPGTPWGDITADEHQAESAYAQFFKPTHGPERHEVIVCHGNILRYFVCRALGAPPERWVNMDIRHCGLSVVMVRANGEPVLVSHNDAGHLVNEVETDV